MAVEATIRRIGGSTFAKLSPEVVKTLGLHAGDMVLLEIQRRGGTAADLDAIRGALPRLPALTERPWDA